jgi:hypothetical protein
MTWKTVLGRHLVGDWPYFHKPATNLAAGGFYTYGPSGDDDPGTRSTGGDTGACMSNPIVRNLGTVDIYVGVDIPSMVILRQWMELPAATAGQPSVLQIPGMYASLTMHNLVGAGAAAEWTLYSDLCDTPTSGAASHPGHARELAGKIVGVPNGAALDTFSPDFGGTVTAIWLWAAGVPTTAGTYTLTVYNGANNMLSAASYDLKSLTPAGTAKSLTLTGTSSHLDFTNTSVFTCTSSSNNADLTNGTYYILFAVTKS